MIVENLMADLREVLGTCSEQKVFSRLTDAVKQLCNKGRFDLSVGFVDVCTHSDGRTITLPREIEVPLATNICGRPAYFRNKWHEFHLNGAGSGAETPWTWDDSGDVSTFMDIVSPSRLIAVSELKTDLSVGLVVMGYDDAGRWIRTQQPDGTWQDGVVIPINMASDFPFGIPVPPDVRYFVRDFTSTPMTRLFSVAAHQLATGAGVTLVATVPPMPPPLLPNITYFARRESATEISLHATRAGALSGGTPIVITSADPATMLDVNDQRQVLVQTHFESAIPHRLTSGKAIQFTGTPTASPFVVGTDYFARKIDDTHFTAHGTEDDAIDNLNPIDATTPGTNVKVTSAQPIDPVPWLDFATNHNFFQGDAVVISNETGAPPEPLEVGVTYYVRIINPQRLTLHNTLADATDGQNPIIFKTAGSGTTSLVKRLPASATLGAINNIQAISHNLTQLGGDLVRFETTGTFPAPITANTAYRAEPPASNDTFSLQTTAPAPVVITTTGTGQLILVISRPFSIGFSSQWRTDAVGLATGDPIKFKTTGSLPTTIPPLNTATTYYLRKIDDKTVEVYDTQANAGSAPATVGRVTVTGLGTGDLSLVFERSVTAIPASDLLRVDPALYIEDGAVGRFITDGTLPPNLMALTDYKLSLENGFLRVKTMADANVPITGIGSGAHQMTIKRAFAVLIPPTVDVVSNNYSDGDKVQLQTTGVLPSPLALLTDYFIRRVDDDHVELYDTEAHAKAAPATTGRLLVLNTGTGLHTLTQNLPPILVARVQRVAKELSDGFISLYGWDPGRTNNLTLLGDYYPDETDPVYRRIKILNPCATITMRFQRRLFQIVSVKDWVPLKNKMAILAMVKALELWRSEFPDRAKIMEDQAEKWMSEDQKTQDGPDVVSVQINSDIFTNPDDQWMT